MTATLTTQAPTFHSLTGTQPIHDRQIAVRPDYAGTIVVLYRAAEQYWVITTREGRHAFTDQSETGATVTIWFDRAEMRYVVDYVDRYGDRVEADRTAGLRAAIGVATDVSAQEWHRARQRR